MRKYHYQTSLPKQWRRWRRVHRTFLILLGLLLLTAGILWWFYGHYLQDISPLSQQGDREQTVYLGPELKTVEADEFIFKSVHDWELEADESAPPERYVYRSRRDGLVIKELTVYRGRVPADLAVTMLVPATTDGTKISPGKASPRCPVSDEIVPKPIRQTYRGVDYWCDTAPSGRGIGVAQTGQGYGFQLSGGTFGFLYKDLSGINLPDPMAFYEILKNFEAK